jgi:hypothetical protein
MDKDWTGNKKSVFVSLGSSAHSEEDREKNDYYATEPKAIRLLLELEDFNKNIWEPACGEGHLSEEMIKKGYNVWSSDLIDRKYGDILDFLEADTQWHGDIITNPPYKYAQAFVEKSLSLLNDGAKLALFLRIQFVEGKARRDFLLKHPIKTIYVSSSRLQCAKNGDFVKYNSSASCYAWYIWEKGYKGTTEIKWFN